MKLNIKKEIVVFDLETTGLDTANDRIIQLAAIKYKPDSNKSEEINMTFNPERPIPAFITELTGISNEQVADKPTFKESAAWLYLFFKDADLCGFNSNRFDIPLLIEEFARAEMNFSINNRNLIDTQVIFHKMEPRNLSAAYLYYCGKKLEGAHDAINDVRATAEVLIGQLNKYQNTTPEGLTSPPIQNDMETLHKFINDPLKVDSYNRFKKNENGIVLFNFGKYNGEPVINQPNFLKWMIEAEFPMEVKNHAREFLKKM
jgi:DNA polymerase-3 subunit epsilon